MTTEKPTTDQATPRPWHYHPQHEAVLQDSTGLVIATVHIAEARPLIVRAVNAHDELVAALAELSDWAYGATIGGPARVARARVILAKLAGGA